MESVHIAREIPVQQEAPASVRGIRWGMFPSDMLLFLGLLLVTIAATYFLPGIFMSGWMLALLVMYFRSDNEPLWFAFFFAVSDGFMGFLGSYDASMQFIPGLPAIQIAQFYIILSVIKANRKSRPQPLFFGGILSVLGAYLVFLIVMGLLLGLSGGLNVYFRVFKITVPFLLFFSLPRLIRTPGEYAIIFGYLFPVAILALATQVTEIATGLPIPAFMGVGSALPIEVTAGRIYRGFYNGGISGVAFAGALFFLAVKKPFSTTYLSLVVIGIFTAVFLSATRGLMIGFGLTLIFYFIFVLKAGPLQMLRIGGLVILLLAAGMTNRTVRLQVEGSIKRFLTLEKLAEGDKTADGTLLRLNERSPRVMKKWKESPILGWGFSSEYFEYDDLHVGNQNLLLHSGIVGALLVLLFFGYFSLSLVNLAFSSGRSYLLVFPLFLFGWFVIHTTSAQVFSYFGLPDGVMAQVLFFCFAAFCYNQVREKTSKGEQPFNTFFEK